MIELINAVQTAGPTPDPAVLAAMDTAAWTAGLTVATWFLVAGAFAAAVFALLTWLDTKKQLAEAQSQTAAVKAQADAAETQAAAAEEQLAAAQESAKVLEASKVSAWLVEALRDENVLELYVRNGNDGPIFDARVNIVAKPAADGASPSPPLRSWDRLFLAPASALVHKPSDEIGPSEFVAGQDFVVRNQIKNPVFARLEDWKIWDGKPGSTGVALELSFRDSAGIYWRRDWHGKLSKLPAEQTA